MALERYANAATAARFTTRVDSGLVELDWKDGTSVGIEVMDASALLHADLLAHSAPTHRPRSCAVHARFRDTTPLRGGGVFAFSTLGAVETHGPRYLRFAALGDSTTFGLGDPVPGGWRGWARLLAEAFAASAYDVSFCNLAIPGATAGSVLRDQLTDAVAHRPDLAGLIVGVNDVLKSTWDTGRVRDDLLTCADALTAEGATLLTARFHDHAAVLPLPVPLRRPLRHRIDQLNAVWDDVHAAYGGLRLDLANRPESLDRSFWSVDRMHPSELGHRCVARAFAAELRAAGVDVELPSAEPAGGIGPTWRRDALWLLAEGAPWIGRRARDLGPWAARLAWQEIRPVRRASAATLRIVEQRRPTVEADAPSARPAHRPTLDA